MAQYAIPESREKQKKICEFILLTFFFDLNPNSMNNYALELGATPEEIRGWAIGKGQPNVRQARYLTRMFRQPIIEHYYIPEDQRFLAIDMETGKQLDMEVIE